MQRANNGQCAATKRSTARFRLPTRIAEVNGDPDLLLWLDEVLVFGALISAAAALLLFWPVGVYIWWLMREGAKQMYGHDQGCPQGFSPAFGFH